MKNITGEYYNPNATGKIPDKHFERLLAEYDSEQGELEGRIEEIRNSIAEFNEFIEKIVLHEADKSGGRLNGQGR